MLKKFKACMGCIAALFVLMIGAALAAPVCPVPNEFTQPNGDIITVTSYGDEFFSWQEDGDGNIIAYDEESRGYKYAEIKDGKIAPTSQTVGEISLFSGFSHKIQRKDIMPLWENAERIDYSNPADNNGIQLMSTDDIQETVETKKLLTILIEFEDVKMHFSNQFWHDEMFDTTPGALSVVNYWKENANGVDVFEPADISSVVDGRTGTVDYEEYTDVGYTITKCSDGVVKVSLDMPHPIKTWDSDEKTIPAPILAEMAVYAIEQDLNFNVERPRIITIFAGYEASTGNGAGKGQVHGYTPLVTMKTSDGMNLGFYTIQGELSYEDVSCGIGIICHEMGHSIFGLPDLYLTSHAALEDDGLGTYSLMANGCTGCRYNRLDNDNDYDNPYASYSAHVPAHLDPWCKIQCGFVTPTIVDEWDGNVNSITDMGTDNKYNVIKVMSKVDPKQYFLIENRQLIGFDKGLEALNNWCYSGNTPFNGGILIYHVDENVGYNSNNTGKHLFISVEQSNRENPSLFHSFEWQYLNINGRNSLNAETIPNSNFHEADNLKICSYEEDCHPQTVKSGISIEVLDESSPSMRVKVNVDDEYKITETDETFSDVFEDINFCNAIIGILSEDGEDRKANDIISENDWYKILSIESLAISERNIKSVKGVEHLSKLTEIICNNNELTELDFSNNPELNYVDCKNNKLTELNLSNCKNLMFLYCSNNSLTKLDIQGNTELLQLNCSSNALTGLNVSSNSKLNRLVCSNNYMDEDYTVGIEGVSNLKQSLVTSVSNFKYLPQKTAIDPPIDFEWIYSPSSPSMKAGEAAAVSAKGLNGGCVLILALYKDDTLVNALIRECENAEESVSIILPSDFEAECGWTLRAFAWNSVSSITPCAEKFERRL